MGVVMFYHLTRSGLDDTLVTLIARARGRDMRVMVRGANAARLKRLDDLLWTHDPDGFLPHGIEGSPSDADHPVLLGQGPIANDARVLALIDGADATVAEANAAERVWILFDGADDARVQAARAFWRQVTEAGIAAQYWSDDSGGWLMKMEKPATPI